MLGSDFNARHAVKRLKESRFKLKEYLTRITRHVPSFHSRVAETNLNEVPDPLNPNSPVHDGMEIGLQVKLRPTMYE